jgi:leucyl aminopeptidase
MTDKAFTTWEFDKACQEMTYNSLHSANIVLSAERPSDSDLIIVSFFGEKDKAPDLTESYDGALNDVIAENAKTFKNGSVLGAVTPVVRIAIAGKIQKIVLLGLGQENKKSEAGFWSKIGSAVASQCDEAKVKTCTLILPTQLTSYGLSCFATDFYSSLYSDNRYRTGDNIKELAKDLETVTIVAESDVNETIAAKYIDAGKALAVGVMLTKDIVNAPHNVLNSESLANVARKIAEDSNGTIKCTILGKEECEKRGMGAYLGVARGSETEPQFIHLTYTPKSGNVNKKVGIVGKGLLFDTGGYNIKTAMMELMKFDCGGSAAVLGAAKVTGALAPEGVEAHFIVAACENMINDRAMVPSDVLTASNGKTIQVVNTDAEGRLTMADALVYADKEVGCESIIELSTLTGACMISLGKKICGVWTDNDDLAAQLEDISKETGEKSWRMPMEKEYNDQLKSKIADLTNCGTRWGGAITAALFLQNFVDESKPFAHIDIAGPVWDDNTGATGFGAKMVSEWVAKQGESA